MIKNLKCKSENVDKKIAEERKQNILMRKEKVKMLDKVVLNRKSGIIY